MINKQFNSQPRSAVELPYADTPFIVLGEQAGTFEMAEALAKYDTPVMLHRDYTVEEIVTKLGVNNTGNIGMTLYPTDRDLKRFTQVYSSLPAQSIHSVYITDPEYADHGGFIKFIQKFRKAYQNIHIIAGEFITEHGMQAAHDAGANDIVMHISTQAYHAARRLSPKLNEAGSHIVASRAALEELIHDDVGAKLVDISHDLYGTHESAGEVRAELDQGALSKRWRDKTYYSNKNADEVYLELHKDLGDLIWQTGFTNIKNFVKFARTED